MLDLQPSSQPQKKIDYVNDFSITFATINGSGSATANTTILRALFKMGIPISGKNIFPSNIQGLPTWYTIRANKNGYLGRVDERHIMVSMNPNTFERDQKSIIPGGVLFYADDFRQPVTRQDITVYPMPVKQIIKEAETGPNLRDYVANMVYVGVVAQILGIHMDAISQALEFHFKGKRKAIDSNLSIIQMAFEWSKQNLVKADPFSVEVMNGTDGYIMADGNVAAALGAIYGGVQFTAWYPITPASSLAESLQELLPVFRKDPETGKDTFAVVQAEDELAAIGMAVGAGWGGLRAMTSTSGPGISLMSEYLGLAYFTEVPVVVWNVQRVGPSTGLPTRTSQSDLTQAYFHSHGDKNFIIMLPGSVNECFIFGWQAFDIAERLQTPVMVLSDLDLGMNQWMDKRFEYPDRPIDRGKILWEEDLEKLLKERNGEWGRFLDIDGDTIPYRTVPGNQHPHSAYFSRGTGHDEYGRYTEEPDAWEKLMKRLAEKYDQARQYMPKPVIETNPGATIGIISMGSNDHAVREARDLLLNRHVLVDYMRVRAIPFTDEVTDFVKSHPAIYVVENNRDGQLRSLLILEYPEFASRFSMVAHNDGLPLTAKWIEKEILSKEEK